mgnify:CR=1 FL=1
MFFTDIGPNLVNQLNTMPINEYKSYLNKTYNHIFNFQSVEVDTIIGIIKNFRTKTSQGVDGISTKLLKFIQDTVAKPLAVIINQTLKEVFFQIS